MIGPRSDHVTNTPPPLAAALAAAALLLGVGLILIGLSSSPTEPPAAPVVVAIAPPRPMPPSRTPVPAAAPRPAAPEPAPRGAAQRLDDAVQAQYGLTPAEERELGEEAHHDVRRGMPLTRRGLRRVLSTAAPLQAQWPGEWRFSVVDDPQVNAFTHVGGYIYVHRGLLDLARTEPELQFVLAHEMGHNRLGHCGRAETYGKRVGDRYGPVAGHVAGLGYFAVALGFSEQQEFAADAWAYDALRALGRTPEECLRFMHRLAGYAARRGLEPAPPADEDATLRALREHFRSHPPTAERLRRLEQRS